MDVVNFGVTIDGVAGVGSAIIVVVKGPRIGDHGHEHDGQYELDAKEKESVLSCSILEYKPHYTTSFRLAFLTVKRNP